MLANDRIRLGVVRVHNAGRSRMAAAFAERERSRRESGDLVEIHSGGTDPADAIHPEVVEVTAEVDIDLTDRSPEYVADLDNLKDSDYLVTMGCSITKFNPEHYGVESHEWDLTNPDGQDVETVREVRDDVETRVKTLFDDLDRLAEKERVDTEPSGGVVTAIRDAFSL